MASPHLTTVIFDIGGVVVRSPLLAIAAYEKEKHLPPNYINCSISGRGPTGAWQRFERGELALFPFYDAFGRDLSDTGSNNVCRRGHAALSFHTDAPLTGCPEFPDNLKIDGRDLFGRMMRESTAYDEKMVEAIRLIRAAKRWRVIALTNNYSSSEKTIMGPEATTMSATSRDRFENELTFLGWSEGPTPPKMRALFDDFLDSSETGLRYAALGLAHSLTPRDSGGRDMTHVRARKEPKRERGAEEKTEGDEDMKEGKLARGYGKIIRDACGAVVEVVLAEEDLSKGGKAGMRIGRPGREKGSREEDWLLENESEEGMSEAVVRGLEGESRGGVKRRRTSSKGERGYLRELVEKHGADYEGMARDRRYSAGKLGRAIAKAGLSV
ncbi:hypothetical protein EW145_g3863 [Phellinidium pouzarii]|uniref:Uncharacterized protein n=1 Tax=Phellinidium pouzarii TaxID=167371 RepID=A0A4S4L5T4_9AGAM|nr:hypothetical protein EW145_g3863 [Phellinidium pouzarii]